MTPIQGPPGTGKTYTAARMICALVKAGKTVGITANSHKVIRNLLDEVVAAAGEMDVDVRCIQKVANRSRTSSGFCLRRTMRTQPTSRPVPRGYGRGRSARARERQPKVLCCSETPNNSINGVRDRRPLGPTQTLG